jgi:hypothetical protein
MIEKRWQRDSWQLHERIGSRVQLWSVKQRATEAEESALLSSVARKRIVETVID